MGAHSWLFCGDKNCQDTSVFPKPEYPLNYITDAYSESDNCCYMPCQYQISESKEIVHTKCDNGEYGCVSDNDCKDGLFCSEHICKDIDECNPTSGYENG